MEKDIIVDYDENIELYKQFSKAMESLLNILLRSSSITPHSVSARVKERTSLIKKIVKKDKYSSLSELTDVVGLRIITHYSDDVDRIANIIEQEFLVDEENSIDKRTSLDPDRFGYLSLHYVVGLSANRSRLIEYQRFDGLKFEIQIRSILQHTWAEIEHDIGYKSKNEIPKPVRRRFSQLAGLLELADDQFIQIRNELVKYEREIPDSIVSSPEDVSIDTVSIYNYVKSSQLLSGLDAEVSEILNVPLIDLTKDNASRHIKYLDYFNVDTISQLEDIINLYRVHILRRASDRAGNLEEDKTSVSKGISIFYLYQVLASQLETEADILSFLNKTKLSSKDYRTEFASYLFRFGEGIA
ncbi:GTP pyrophosphokinase [Photobacterium kagoshimensis]|uniref:GTP pyrophosphokinase n=2 Tax=Photobacterium kagoshimensis TaxID=2910242 RepID=UPI003D0B7A28